MGSSSKDPKQETVVGYLYSLGMHMAICHGPIDSLTKITVGERTVWEGNESSGEIGIRAENVFGLEGGIVGNVDIESGSSSQGANSYLQEMIESSIPAFRGVFALVFKKLGIGKNPYLKPFAFRVSRIHTLTNGAPQWNNGQAAIGPDMNPIHILRECLTSTDWGMGYPEADVDETSFLAAATQLKSEGMGMSLLWDKTMALDEFIAIILKHIDGSLYVDRTTGKFCVKLTRADYNVATIPSFGEADIDRIVDFKRSSVGELVNSVTVKFWDTAEEKDNSVTVQDISLIAKQRATIATTVQYPGFTNSDIANRVASRDLQFLSSPIAKATIYFNRKASSLNIGEVFKLVWPRLGIDQIIFRVANIELGELTSNLVKVTAVEDLFGLPSAIYAASPPSAWTPPVTTPIPAPYNVIEEVPFYDIAKRKGDEFAQLTDVGTAYFQAASSKPSGTSYNSTLTVLRSGNYVISGTANFFPTAQTTADMDINQTSIPIQNLSNIALIPIGSYCMIGTELCSVVSITSSLLVLGRGVLDTVPREHPQGTIIYFPYYAWGTDNVEYTTGGSVNVRLLTNTPAGQLASSSAVTLSKTFVGRAFKPYPPAGIKMNGTLINFESGDLYGTISLSWFTRNRVNQTVSLVPQTTGHIAPEAGQTYTFEIRNNANNALEQTISGLSTSGSFTQSTSPSIKIIVYSVRGGIKSYQQSEFVFIRHGMGFLFGSEFGGVLA